MSHLKFDPNNKAEPSLAVVIDSAIVCLFLSSPLLSPPSPLPFYSFLIDSSMSLFCFIQKIFLIYSLLYDQFNLLFLKRLQRMFSWYRCRKTSRNNGPSARWEACSNRCSALRPFTSMKREARRREERGVSGRRRMGEDVNIYMFVLGTHLLMVFKYLLLFTFPKMLIQRKSFRYSCVSPCLPPLLLLHTLFLSPLTSLTNMRYSRRTRNAISPDFQRNLPIHRERTSNCFDRPQREGIKWVYPLSLFSLFALPSLPSPLFTSSPHGPLPPSHSSLPFSSPLLCRYGKHFLLLDNGYKREDSVKDIGALLDWVSRLPNLDAAKIGVYGRSYGGYMVLASLIHFGDRYEGVRGEG